MELHPDNHPSQLTCTAVHRGGLPCLLGIQPENLVVEREQRSWLLPCQANSLLHEQFGSHDKVQYHR